MIIFNPKSENKKTGRIAVTYAPIAQSCPVHCFHRKERTCYALQGKVGIHARRLEKGSTGLTPIQIARQESKAIRAAFKGGLVPKIPLRLHVSGDCRTIGSAKVVSAACRNWTKRGGDAPYTYTHAWETVPRSAWDGVSVLASVETPEQAKKALSMGYAPAITIPEHASHKKTTIGGVTFIPCPEQTKGIPCVKCRLCFNADRLARKKLGIAFAIHGVRKNHGKRKLEVIQ